MTLAILATAFLIPQAAVLARRHGSWLAPGPLFVCYWTIALALPMIAAPDQPVSLQSVAYIVAATTSFAFGSLLISGQRTPRSGRRITDPPVPFLKRIIFIGVTSTLAATVLRVRAQGFNVNDAFSLEGLLTIGNSLSIARYSAGIAGTQVTAMMLSLGYAACIVAPYLGSRREIGRLLVFAPAFSCVIYSMLTTERLVLLIALALTGASIVYSRIYTTGTHLRIGFRGLASAVLGALVTAGLFVSVAFIRVGVAAPEMAATLYRKLAVYAFGYLSGFSIWLESYTTANDPLGTTWGASSIAGIEYLTGISREETRSYGIYVTLNNSGDRTNIYTIFRNLLLDFTEPGAVIVLVIWGAFSTYVYHRAVTGVGPGSIALGSAMTALVLLSNTMSILTFTNVTVAVIVAYLALSVRRPAHRDYRTTYGQNPDASCHELGAD